MLPDLIDTPTEEIRRVAIDRGDEHLVFECRDRGQGRWQIVEPIDVAAEPSRIEALVRNLKDLRKSPDAGTITAPSESFGLTPPAATIRLFASPRGSTGADRPIASLEVGKVVQGRRYVRRVGLPGIDVVEARFLGGLDQPLPDWREPVLMGVPTFEVASVKITRPGAPAQSPRSSRPIEAATAAGT